MYRDSIIMAAGFLSEASDGARICLFSLLFFIVCIALYIVFVKGAGERRPGPHVDDVDQGRKKRKKTEIDRDKRPMVVYGPRPAEDMSGPRPDEDIDTERIDPLEITKLVRDVDHPSQSGTDQEPEHARTIGCPECDYLNMADAAFCESCRTALNPGLLRQQLRWREGQVNLTVGREHNMDISIRSLNVSRQQARVVFRTGTLTVQDWGDTLNGTWLCGRRVEQPTMIIPGDLISFGVVKHSPTNRS